jgi:dihydroxyacetone kinase-like predicted kinase
MRTARSPNRPRGRSAAVAEAALRQARATLERTPEMVPALASAGVVDAGGLGIVLLLDAIGAAIRGAGLTVPVGPSGPVGARGFDVPASDQRFEVQFVLEGSGGTIPALRADLARIGDSLVVAGDDPTRTVHVHTNDPDAALAAGRRAGAISQAAVRSLEERIAACWDGSGARAGSDRRTTGLIAVAEGAGLIDAFRSLGADVVEGGFGRDPAVGEVRAAIDAAAAELGVIVLPNAPAAVAVAGLAADLARIRARVVPVTSMPAGLSAATAYNPNATLAANARAMTAAAAACAAGEVGEAVIAAATRAGDVEPGGWVAVRAREVVAVAGDAPTAALALAEALRSDTPDPQIITVVLGRGAPDADADAAVRALRVAHPDLELQPVAGGQPRFRYLIGIE